MTRSTNPDRDLTISRVIKAPRSAIWKAWTDPASFEQWWIPEPLKCRVVEMDLRPGGSFVTQISENGVDYPSFVYVDRIVTAPAARGRGLARMLYGDLIERARAAGHERIVCEVNSDPPNPASEAFHRNFGFVPVGSAPLANGKTVTYLELPIRAVTSA